MALELDNLPPFIDVVRATPVKVNKFGPVLQMTQDIMKYDDLEMSLALKVPVETYRRWKAFDTVHFPFARNILDQLLAETKPHIEHYGDET